MKKSISRFPKILALCKYRNGGKFIRYLRKIYNPKYFFTKRKDEFEIDNIVIIYEPTIVYEKIEIEKGNGKKVTRILEIPFKKWEKHERDKQGVDWLISGWKKFDNCRKIRGRIGGR